MLKYSDKEILKETVLTCLRIVEVRTNHWYTYDDSAYMNGAFQADVETSLRILSILKNGWDWVVPELKLKEINHKPIIEYKGRDISKKQLSDLFGVDYEILIKEEQ